tara:strand:- start:466 stop:600 length:135 start_codon:yes stop_codon:yes gene_type:complete
MNDSDPGNMELMKKEIEIMNKLKHKHVVNQIESGEAIYKKKKNK